MRKTRLETEETRQRIVTTTARLIREKGIAGVGVAELMKQSGLTHGGFYKHFPSKDALVAEACEAALKESRNALAASASNAARHDRLAAIIASYLSSAHRDHPERGCLIAASGDEAVRGGPDVREAIAGGTQRLVDLVADQLSGIPAEKARVRARGIVASLIGTMVMARALDDRAASDALLADMKAFLLGDQVVD